MVTTRFFQGMKRGRGVAAVSGLFFVCTGLLTAGEAFAFSVSYDQEVTVGDRVITSTVRLKDEQFRVDTPLEGASDVIIRNPSGVYHYMSNARTAQRLSVSSLLEYDAKDLEDFLGYLSDQHATVIGSETIHGYPCDIYRFTDQSSGEVITTWVWKDKRFPVKIEQQLPQGRVVAVMTNVQVGVDIPDAVFQLPADTQVLDSAP